ncbi:MAG: hypothetical protein K9M56_08670 [Victivallales bacterium]|nr:hypothetical protein [Victivallales bacterium]
MIELGPFDKWVMKNQIDCEHDYYKGWWDSVEFIRKLVIDFPLFEFDVIKTFMMDTPPPTTKIPMPLLDAKSENFELFFKESWVIEPDWTVSIKGKLKEPLELYNFIKEIDQNMKWLLRGIDNKYIFPTYNDKAEKFTGSVRNKHLLYGLFQILQNIEKNKYKNM